MNQTPISNPFDEDERGGRRPIAWVILGLGILCSLGFFMIFVYAYKPNPQDLVNRFFPSPTPDLHATAQVIQATETATARQALVENAANNWDVILTDMFDSNENNWLVESSDDEYSLTNYEIVGGKYKWDATAHQSFIGWVRADLENLTDFYISVEVRQLEGPDTADYGIIFREDDNSNFYYFGITNQGQYILYVFFDDWERLIDWTQTDLIRPDEANRITVVGEGPHFTFFINDHYLTEFTDSRISQGSTALAIEMENENDHGVFEFDNFELHKP